MERSITPRACPRCRGALAWVEDIGDSYQSCVQCGHVVYGRLQAPPRVQPEPRWSPRQAADRSAVRRRQIARAKARARASEGAVA